MTNKHWTTPKALLSIAKVRVPILSLVLMLMWKGCYAYALGPPGDDEYIGGNEMSKLCGKKKLVSRCFSPPNWAN